MSCVRCGQSRPRPVTPPSGITRRPGASGTFIPSRPATGGGLPNSVIRSAITGLRYVPGK